MTAFLKDKRLRYGSYSTVMIVAVICLFILVNLVADRFNISRDITQDRIFSLSEDSITIARELTADVTIYTLWPTGHENFMFQQILEEYAAHSSRITVVNRDPVLHPHFVEQFAAGHFPAGTIGDGDGSGGSGFIGSGSGSGSPISDGSIIVVGPNRFRVIQSYDLFTTDFDFQTFQPAFQPILISIDIEPQVTNAIRFVVTEDNPVIYRIVGNNEFFLPPNLIQKMEMAGYEIREINPITHDIPEYADMLLITIPERDWSPIQAERILNYLENDGRALFIVGYRAMPLPKMEEVLAAFGIGIGSYVVVEGNPGYFARNIPNMLLPDFISSEITDTFIERDFFPLLFQSTGIEILELRRPNVVISPLIRTSNQAFGRTDPANLAVTKLPEDISGPFNLAVKVEDNFFIGAARENLATDSNLAADSNSATDSISATDSNSATSLTTRIVVIGSEFILSEDLNFDMGGTNWSFIINSLNWLREEPASIFIPSRTPPQITPLTMNQAQANLITLFSLVILPLAFGIMGLIVWLRRRNA